MGKITIEDIPKYKTLYFTGTYTKDLGDDEYIPKDFVFLLSITVDEHNNTIELDIEDVFIEWKESPSENREEKLLIEQRIIDYYYNKILL